MRRIIKRQVGDLVPDDAVFLQSVNEVDNEKSFTVMPINANEQIRQVHFYTTFHYYEVKESAEESHDPTP